MICLVCANCCIGQVMHMPGIKTMLEVINHLLNDPELVIELMKYHSGCYWDFFPVSLLSKAFP